MVEIIMFTSPTCPHCTTAKDYLRSKGYKFIEKNIQTDLDARHIMQEHKLMGVPAFIIGNDSFSGLDIHRIESLIDYKVNNCPKCNQALRIPKNKGSILVTCSKCNQKFKIKT